MSSSVTQKNASVAQAVREIPELTAGKLVGATLHSVKLMTYASGLKSAWSAAQAARDLDMNASTCFNIIQTLVALGWLSTAESTGRAKRYTVGAAFVGLLQGVAASQVDARELPPLLQDYADRWKVTATLWRRQSLTRMELVAIASCQNAINVQMPMGQRLPILMGGMGRIMALREELDDALRQQIFASIRWDRPFTYEQFMLQVRKARRLGWGVDEGFMNRSVTALAAPVVRDGHALAALTPNELDDTEMAGHDIEYMCSATMFRHQYSSVVLPEMATSLIQLAARIEPVLYPRI